MPLASVPSLLAAVHGASRRSPRHRRRRTRPATSMTPTGSRLALPSRNARTAPASISSVPREGLAYFSHSLKRRVTRLARGKARTARARPRGTAAERPSRSRCRSPSRSPPQWPSRPHDLRAHSRPSPERRGGVADLQIVQLRREVAHLADDPRGGIQPRVGREQPVDVLSSGSVSSAASRHPTWAEGNRCRREISSVRVVSFSR